MLDGSVMKMWLNAERSGNMPIADKFIVGGQEIELADSYAREQLQSIVEQVGQGGSGVAGADGREIELQKSTTHIQWRYVGDSTWNNLVALSELKGDKGDTGQAGQDGQDAIELWQEVTVAGGNLNLTTDKHQYCSDVSTLAEIILPSVSDMYEVVEIHLFINPTSDITAILPSCSWQNNQAPTLNANKVYELIFTYCNSWLGGVITYE